ncbi:MAG: efflux RND transporter periplasmic adaptor subunit [Pseudomonadota bacterium]
MRSANRITVLVTSVALFVGTLAGCGDTATSAQISPNALLVTPYTVASADAYDAVQRYSGQVQAARESRLGFELGGELASVLVDEGDSVDAGAVLARLDTARLTAVRSQAAAAVDEARSKVELADSTLARLTRAQSFDGVSSQEVDVAQDQLAASQTALAAAQSRLTQVDIDVRKSSLRAPYAGSVIARHVDEGQIVAAGQAVLEFQESAALEVRLSVTGEALDSMTPGRQVTLVIGDQPVAATVSAAIARRNLRTRAVEVILAIDEGAPARVGDIAQLEFSREVVQSGYWVPLSALTEGARGVWNVLAIMPAESRVSDADQRATGATHALANRPVELLYHDEQRVFVRGAIEAGDVIVADGLQRVVPGQGVRVETGAPTAEIVSGPSP